MEEQQDGIIFITDEGEEVPFFVIEKTMLAGREYLLVADSQEEEAQAYIMRKIMDEEQQEIYEMVEGKEELDALSRVFAELLEDMDIEF